MPEENKIKQEKPKVELDTSGPEVDVTLPEEVKEEEVIETKEQETVKEVKEEEVKEEPVKEDDLIIFPAALSHEIAPQGPTKEPRITISSNIKIEGL